MFTFTITQETVDGTLFPILVLYKPEIRRRKTKSARRQQNNSEKIQ